MTGRTFSSNKYRYGFNGKEKDDEIKGDGTQQDYGMRIYDPRLGKFLSVDPLTKKYPELTPYQFGSNRPIDGIDQDGLEYVTYTIYVNKETGKVRDIKVAKDYELKNEATKGAGKEYIYVFEDNDKNEICRDDPDFKANGATDYGIFGGGNNPMIPTIGDDYKKLHNDLTLDPIDEYDAQYKNHDQGFKDGGIETKKQSFENDGAFVPNRNLLRGIKEVNKKWRQGKSDAVTGKKITFEGRKYAVFAKFYAKGSIFKNKKQENYTEVIEKAKEQEKAPVGEDGK
jgi:RHS repeat-associated protein